MTNTQASLTATSESLAEVFAGINSANISEVERQCGGELSWVNETIKEVSETIHALQSNIDVALDLSDCPSITPILQQITFGTTCAESVEGLTFFFSITLAITVLCMIMLTTRAALFNPLKRARRKKRREKEFQEYREYMSKFYDTSKWELDAPGLREILGSPTRSTDSDGTDASDHSASLSAFNIELELVDDADVQAVKVTEPAAPFTPKRRRADDRDIIYYSSDSDSEDEASIAQSLNSSISAFARHIWSRDGSSRASESRPALPFVEADEDSQDDEESGALSADVSMSSMMSRFLYRLRQQQRRKSKKKALELKENVPCPTWQESPYACQLTQKRRPKDPLNLGMCQNSILSDESDPKDEELYPLSPARAPRKALKHLPRTNGARQITLAERMETGSFLPGSP